MLLQLDPNLSTSAPQHHSGVDGTEGSQHQGGSNGVSSGDGVLPAHTPTDFRQRSFSPEIPTSGPPCTSSGGQPQALGNHQYPSQPPEGTAATSSPPLRRAGPPPAPRPALPAAGGHLAAACGALLRGSAAAMSAEAADREAATSSRPCTPPQTSWFEFLLEEQLLEQHLRKPSPGAWLEVEGGGEAQGRGLFHRPLLAVFSFCVFKLQKCYREGFFFCWFCF